MNPFNNNSMDNYLKNRQEFDKYFAKFKLKKGEKKMITHTCLGMPFGSYHIPDDKYDKFIMLYKKIAGKCNNLHIIERHDGRTVGPFIVDIDYWVDDSQRGRKYRLEHIEKLIEITNDVLRTYFKVTDENLEALVMEKEKPTYNEKDKKYKDGFHLLYPIGLSVRHRFFVSDQIKKKAISVKLFDDIPFTNSKGYDEIFDTSVVRSNGLTMYGSRKHNGHRTTKFKIRAR